MHDFASTTTYGRVEDALFDLANAAALEGKSVTLQEINADLTKRFGFKASYASIYEAADSLLESGRPIVRCIDGFKMVTTERGFDSAIARMKCEEAEAMALMGGGERSQQALTDKIDRLRRQMALLEMAFSNYVEVMVADRAATVAKAKDVVKHALIKQGGDPLTLEELADYAKFQMGQAVGLSVAMAALRLLAEEGWHVWTCDQGYFFKPWESRHA